MSSDFSAENVQYHQNWSLPFATANAIRYRSHRLAVGSRNGAKCVCLLMKSIWFQFSCYFPLKPLLFSFFSSASPTRLIFGWPCFCVCVRSTEQRPNVKFSVLRWCYDLCSIAKCMNDSIVVTVIHYSSIFFSSLRFLGRTSENLRKLREEREKIVPNFHGILIEEHGNWTREIKWNSHRLARIRELKPKEKRKKKRTNFGGCIECMIVEHK